MIVGVGAQGSTIAKRMDEEPGVSEIICADYDRKAAQELSGSLAKAKAIQLNAHEFDDVVSAAAGCDLIVNGLPLEFNLNVMEAALAVNASYIDMAGPMESIGFVESYKLVFSNWHERFKAKGLTALIGCGSSPGLANVIARESVEKVETCESIGIYVYEGVWTRRFTPFWWSPEVAFGDMAFKTFRFENGVHVTDRPFSRPSMMRFRGIDHPVRMVDHEHDEPVTMGLQAEKALKGVRNVEFKYGGPGVELAEMLYKMGLLSTEAVSVKDTRIVPMDLVLELCPPAPKYPAEIKEIIDEGVLLEEGAFLVRVDGQAEESPIRIDCYVNAPGLVESFDKAGLSHEAYLTGQCAAGFVKLMVDDVFTEKGLFAPEQLNAASRRYYFHELAKLSVTIDEIIEKSFLADK